MKLYRNRGGTALADVLVCAGILFLAPGLFSAQTNGLNNSTRARDDKSAMVNLALQVVQQLQAQQQTNLHAIAEIKQQAEVSTLRTAESMSSLRRLILLSASILAVGMILLLLYEQRQFRSLRQRLMIRTTVPAMSTSRSTGAGTAVPVAQLLAKGQVLLHRKQVAEALSIFSEVIALDPDFPQAHIKKGIALEQLGRLEDALASFDHALMLDPGCAEAHVGKGDVFNRLERYEEALACFEQATRLQPKAALVA